MCRVFFVSFCAIFMGLIINFSLSTHSYAGQYLGEYCWTYETDDNDVKGTIRLGVNHIGDNHYMCSGVIDVQSPIKMKFPTFGNVEFVDDKVVVTLSLNGIRDGQIGVEMIKLELDPVTFNGKTESFGAYMDANEYVEGKVTFVDCD